MMIVRKPNGAMLIIAIVFSAWSSLAAAQSTLREAFKDKFLVGAALNLSQFTGGETQTLDLIDAQFNSISPENVMKWDALHPAPGIFNFDAADRFVDFGERHGMSVIGHTLIWHSQTPEWVFQDEQGRPASRKELLERMQTHIQMVVGRYKGRIRGWDVVNEVIEEDGQLRDSPWRRIIGDDYLVKAFQFAHEADPSAELYYNDYGIESREKREGAIQMLKTLQAAGAPITGVGIQEHVNLRWPKAGDIDEAIADFSALGLKVMITELDVDVLPSNSNGDYVSADISRREKDGTGMNPYAEGLPDEIQQKLAERYAELFSVYLKHADVVERVTFWGVTDGESWLNHFPIPGRISYPLLFDRTNKPKPAFQDVIETALNHTSASKPALDAKEQ